MGRDGGWGGGRGGGCTGGGFGGVLGVFVRGEEGREGGWGKGDRLASYSTYYLSFTLNIIFGAYIIYVITFLIDWED